MARRQRLVVIGGVAAGMSAASSAKRIRPQMEVTVLEKDAYISYGACSLPYYISNDVKDVRDLFALTPEAAEKERGITVITRHEVLAIDKNSKEVLARDLERGKEVTLPYDKLVLATGGSPIIPRLPGVDLKHIFTVRTLNDGLAIKAYTDEERPKRAVIVGGGYIGMEMSESLRKRGLEVTVIEKMDRVLGTMDTEITDIVEGKLASEDVELHKETSVERFEGEDGVVRRVFTDRGSFDADLVLLAVGVRPNTELAKGLGVELGARGAIGVDEHLCTNVPDIYAAGDCAETLHLVTCKKVYIPLGTTANKQGRIAGENVAGLDSVFEGVVGSAVSKIFDLEVARTGLTAVEAKGEGYEFFGSTIEGWSRSRAYPAGEPITVTYIVEKESGRLLGAQMVGTEGVAHRIDTLAAALYARMTVDEVARLDLAYAPPFASVWDPILIAANVALKKLKNGS
ncbi:MAG: CoA-disulfide reductase [Deltaproteobacteria bacterium]|nr:MAG: CoA-disulfide reductase [Deltaproteobacteria bacterium]